MGKKSQKAALNGRKNDKNTRNQTYRPESISDKNSLSWMAEAETGVSVASSAATLKAEQVGTWLVMIENRVSIMSLNNKMMEAAQRSSPFLKIEKK